MTFNLQDALNLEGETESTEEEYFASLQRAINSLEVWKFPGSYGRTMMRAIEDGRCLLGRHDTRDYWGNHIPSRDQVQAGTKGSKLYVAERCGEEWAKQMEEVE